MHLHRAHRFSRVAAGAALLGTLLVPGLSAQEGPDPSSVFGDVVDVRVVNLEVVVTKDGERETGLLPEDLVLTVDGREVPIEYFTEVEGGTAVASGGEAARATVPALLPGKPVSTSYLVFIDDYFTIGARRNRVLSRLLEQVSVLNPEDRMAVVSFDGRRLDMLTSWTQSPEELERVLTAAMARPARGAQAAAERRLHETSGEEELQAQAEANQPVVRGQAVGQIGGASGLFNSNLNGARVGNSMPSLRQEQAAGVVENQVRRVVAAAASALRGFANPPGRKVMMLLAGGWPYSPAEWTISDPTLTTYTTGFGYGQNLYGPLIQTANRLSYTIYPIDTPFSVDEERFQQNDATLRLIARDTGGRALFRAATTDALTEVVRDTRSYYWIGFTPQWKGDDSSHRVEVRARQKGLEIRSRTSFADFSRQQEVTMMVESALLLGDTPPAAEPMPAQLGEMKPARHGKLEVPIRMLVPMAALTFLPHEGHYVAEAELRVAIQDAKGTTENSPVVPLTITLDEPPKEGEMRRWETTLTLRNEHHDLIVALYDKASGAILTSKLEVLPN